MSGRLDVGQWRRQPQDYGYSVIQAAGRGMRVVFSTDDRDEAVREALARPYADVFDNDCDEGGWLRVQPIPLGS